MQRSIINYGRASYDFLCFGNDFRKNGNKKKRDLRLATNFAEIPVIPSRAFVP